MEEMVGGSWQGTGRCDGFAGVGAAQRLTDLYGVLVEGDVHLVADLLHLGPRERLGAQVPA